MPGRPLGPVGQDLLDVLIGQCLVAALDRLQSDGLIVAHREEIVDGRLRRYYRLTDDGASALAAEVDALRRRTEVAARRLASPARLNRGASPA